MLLFLIIIALAIALAIGLYVHFAFNDNISAAYQDAAAKEKAIAAKIAAAEELAVAEADKINGIVAKIKSGSPWNVPPTDTNHS